MSNISVPSPSIIRYSTSAFFPVSASVAFTLPMAVPTGEDSRTLRWMVSVQITEKKRESEISSIEYLKVKCVWENIINLKLYIRCLLISWIHTICIIYSLGTEKVEI